MSLWKGPVTVRRYTIEGLPDEDRRQHLRRGLVQGAFSRPPTQPLPGETVIGFVLPEDAWLDTDFEDDARWWFSTYATLGVRIDRFDIPAAKAKARLYQRMSEWVKQNQVERCPSLVKKQLKEAVAEELRSEGRWKTKIVDVCVAPGDAVAFVGTVSLALEDEIRKLFFRRMNLKLTPTRFLSSGEEEGTVRLLSIGAEDFLAYLLHGSELGDGGEEDLGSGVRIFVSSRISLRGGSDDRQITVRGDAAAGAAEVRRAIQDGRMPSAIQIEIVTQEGEDPAYSCILQGDMPDVTQAKLLQGLEGRPVFGEELVVERMFLVEKLWALLEERGQFFAKMPGDEREARKAALMAWAKDSEDSEKEHEDA